MIRRIPYCINMFYKKFIKPAKEQERIFSGDEVKKYKIS